MARESKIKTHAIRCGFNRTGNSIFQGLTVVVVTAREERWTHPGRPKYAPRRSFFFTTERPCFPVSHTIMSVFIRISLIIADRVVRRRYSSITRRHVIVTIIIKVLVIIVIFTISNKYRNVALE